MLLIVAHTFIGDVLDSEQLSLLRLLRITDKVPKLVMLRGVSRNVVAAGFTFKFKKLLTLRNHRLLSVVESVVVAVSADATAPTRNDSPTSI